MPRKQYTIHYIYKTTNIITGKFYVGMHSTFDLDDGYIGSGKYLWYSIKKYGKENHKKEIIEFYNSRKELIQREKEIINENFIKNKLCMNLSEGVTGGKISGFDYMKFSKIGNLTFINKLKTDTKFRKYYKELSRQKYINSCKRGIIFNKINNIRFEGKKHTEETKKKIGNANSIKQNGEKNSQYGKCWIYNIKLKVSKSIKKVNLKEYLDASWIKGRKLKFN